LTVVNTNKLQYYITLLLLDIMNSRVDFLSADYLPRN